MVKEESKVGCQTYVWVEQCEITSVPLLSWFPSLWQYVLLWWVLSFLFCGAQFRHLRPPRETVRKTSCVLGNPDPAVVKIFPTFLNSLAMDPVTVFFWKCRNEILVQWRKNHCCSCFQTCLEFHQNVAKVIRTSPGWICMDWCTIGRIQAGRRAGHHGCTTSVHPLHFSALSSTSSPQHSCGHCSSIHCSPPTSDSWLPW